MRYAKATSCAQLLAVLLLSSAAGVCGQGCSLADQLPAIQPNVTCQARPDCDGLLCRIIRGRINGTTSSFAVQKCLDPVSVTLNLTQTMNVNRQVLQYRFNANGSMSVEVDGSNSTVSVVMNRNATHLYIVAYAEVSVSERIPLTVPVYVPLEPAQCMCASLTALASRIDSPVEHDCRPNDACNGVLCSLEVFGAVFYVETIVLPCLNAVELVVEDSNMEPIHTDFFNKTEVRVIMIGILSLLVEVDITVYPYSMDVRAVLNDFIFGETDIIPMHRIILDRTACDFSSIPTVAPPSFTELPTLVPSRDATQTCLAFYDIARNTAEPFVCRLLNGCSGLGCRLDIQASRYSINIELVGCGGSNQDNLHMLVAVLNEDGQRLAEGRSSLVYSLPQPAAMLMFESVLYNTTHLGFDMQVSVDLFPFPDRVTTLIANTALPLDCPKSGLSSSQVAAVAIVVPLVGILIAGSLVVLVVVVILCVRHRGRVGQFSFKPMSFNELRKKDTIDNAAAAVQESPVDTEPASGSNEAVKEDLGSTEPEKPTQPE